jgi:hypothetical protein
LFTLSTMMSKLIWALALFMGMVLAKITELAKKEIKLRQCNDMVSP